MTPVCESGCSMVLLDSSRSKLVRLWHCVELTVLTYRWSPAHDRCVIPPPPLTSKMVMCWLSHVLRHWHWSRQFHVHVYTFNASIISQTDIRMWTKSWNCNRYCLDLRSSKNLTLKYWRVFLYPLLCSRYVNEFL
jgi:hypothetical protein